MGPMNKTTTPQGEEDLPGGEGEKREGGPLLQEQEPGPGICRERKGGEEGVPSTYQGPRLSPSHSVGGGDGHPVKRDSLATREATTKDKMNMVETPKADATTALASSTGSNAGAKAAKADNTSKGNTVTKPVAVVTWQHTAAPQNIANMAIVNVNDDTGRKDKLGNPILSKSLVIRTKTAKETGLSGDDARESITRAGTEAKPILMGRVSAFASHGSVMIRRYQETKGNGKSTGDSIIVKLERRNTESDIEKLARTYGITPEEVMRRLNVKPITTVDV